MPAEPVSLGQAYFIAEQQGTLLPRLLGMTHVPVDVDRVSRLSRVALGMKPREEMDGRPAKSRWWKGRWEIVACQDDPIVVRRFALAREIKRVLDATTQRVVYAGLRCENEAHYQHRIESICDHFASCLLMPRVVVRRAWTSGLNDLACLAELFQVSVMVMERRLTHLGLINLDRAAAGPYTYTGSGVLTAM